MNARALCSTVLLLVMGAACGDGATGPAGPQGPVGAQGPAGLAGADGTNGTNGTNGTDGTNGNANVRSTIVRNVQLTLYTTTSIAVPALTRDILDNGAVLVYARPAGSSIYWTPFPLMDGLSDTWIWVNHLEVGWVRFHADFGVSPQDIRVVTIAGTPASALVSRYPGVDFGDPEAVQRALGVRF
jgi:hypothetical protein